VALCARNLEKLERCGGDQRQASRVAEAAGEMDDAAALCGGAASAGVVEPVGGSRMCLRWI